MLRTVCGDEYGRRLCAAGNAPYGMNRITAVVALQHQNTWSFRELGVVLYNDSILHSREYVYHKNIIFGEFIVAVRRDSHFARLSQSLNGWEKFAHVITRG